MSALWCATSVLSWPRSVVLNVSDPSLKLSLMDPADILFAASGISINHLTNSIRDRFLLQAFLVVTELETN